MSTLNHTQMTTDEIMGSYIRAGNPQKTKIFYSRYVIPQLIQPINESNQMAAIEAMTAGYQFIKNSPSQEILPFTLLLRAFVMYQNTPPEARKHAMRLSSQIMKQYPLGDIYQDILLQTFNDVAQHPSHSKDVQRTAQMAIAFLTEPDPVRNKQPISAPA